jgi:hypothetical protein
MGYEMNLTQHAELRSIQRAISEEEMLILSGIGMEVEQKGGTTIITVIKEETDKWITVLKEVLTVLNKLRPARESKAQYRRSLKAVKRLIGHLQSQNLPYFVINQESNNVITCGHFSML